MSIKEAVYNTITNENRLNRAIEESRAISYQRFVPGEKDEARSIKKLVPLHSAIGNMIAENINPSYTICAYGVPFHESKNKIKPGGQELSFPAACIGNKRADIAIARQIQSLTPTGLVAAKYKYEPVLAVLSKCVFTNYSQNANNYTQCEYAETGLIRRKGYPVATLFMVEHHPNYFKKTGVFSHTETFGADDVRVYCERYDWDPSKDVDRPNAMFLYVFDVDNDGKITKTSAEDLGLDPDHTRKYNEMSNINNLLMGVNKCLLKI